jgi:uncharacterized protein
MYMHQYLFKLLVCPVCQSSLHYEKSTQELICLTDRLAYSIQDDIPIMLPDSARPLPLES